MSTRAIAAILAVAATSCTAAHAGAPPKADAAPARIEVGASKPDARARWAEVEKAIAQCRVVDVMIWYSFGSAFVRVGPAAGGACAVDVSTDVEGASWRAACAAPRGTAWTWDLVFDENGARQAPPRAIPPSARAICRESP
jgi:hypothetical protein